MTFESFLMPERKSCLCTVVGSARLRAAGREPTLKRRQP